MEAFDMQKGLWKKYEKTEIKAWNERASYDELYDELERLEAETGVVMADSPTVKVGYESVDELPKEKHNSPMLSLNKTKDQLEK